MLHESKEVTVAVGVLMTIPGTKEKHYNRINECMLDQWPIDSSEAPSGLIVHSAGPVLEGFQRFGEEQLGACGSKGPRSRHPRAGASVLRDR